MAVRLFYFGIRTAIQAPGQQRLCRNANVLIEVEMEPDTIL